jgi:1,4-alpha-glucan branching enzyme
MMTYRGRPRGEPSAALPPIAFISFIQNHDQVGNRAFGDRITQFCSPEAVRAVAAIYLMAPQIPMLFMGEEWGAAQPFPFFCDFKAELGEAVRQGRTREFARFPQFQDPANRSKLPDPTARETFLSAKLRWEDADRSAHAEWLGWYRKVIGVRRAEIVPRLTNISGHSGRYEIIDDLAVCVQWRMGDGSLLGLATNLKERPSVRFTPPPGRILWSEGVAQDGRLGPWSVIWTLLAEGPR